MLLIFSVFLRFQLVRLVPTVFSISSNLICPGIECDSHGAKTDIELPKLHPEVGPLTVWCWDDIFLQTLPRPERKIKLLQTRKNSSENKRTLPWNSSHIFPVKKNRQDTVLPMHPSLRMTWPGLDQLLAVALFMLNPSLCKLVLLANAI